MTHRLLLVEQSTTMRSVMEKHANSLGFSVDACDTYEQASQSLDRQFQQFGADYSGLIFGWPTDPQDDAAAFAKQLESSDHRDLPVVVMSTDMRAEARAWIASRGNTAMLGWKEYQGLESHLRRLIAISTDENHDNDIGKLRPDNHDIHVLVVDDSATIRYSMRDLFELHGYKVTLAATREEAMRDAGNTAIDIAVLDYYLTETTGDVLCRELLSSDKTGDIVCTILTGTYSDHIIKRSLRAGAVECMFKNESSELLLSRINAIGQFIRQRRQLQAERQRLEDVLECIAGSILLISDAKLICYVNSPAIEVLGITDKSVLVGQSAQVLLEAEGPGAPGKEVHSVDWTLPNGEILEVDYQHSLIESSGYSLVRFARRSMLAENTELVVLQRPSASENIVRAAISEFSLAPDTELFLMNMRHYLNPEQNTELGESESTADGNSHVSLFLLDVFLRTDDDEVLIPVSKDEAIATIVDEKLKGLVTSEGHIVALDENRYGFLLRHAEESQAFVMTRKIMQHCLEIMNLENSSTPTATLACTGSLLGLTKNAAQPMSLLLKHAFNGLELVNSREPNQAILLDVRRLLRAYPPNE